MKTAYYVAIAGFVIVFAMLFYPSLHLMLGGLDTTGMPPIQTAVMTVVLPLFFLFFAGYLINRMRG